jgi:hypothetical protein
VAEFRVCVHARATARDVWDLVTDWPAHSRFVPLTTVTRTRWDGGPGLGDRFVGRTGVGPLAIDDPMEVVEWSPPAGGGTGRCTLAKLGGVVLGRATIEVEPTGASACRVCWYENVEIAPVRLTRFAAPLVAVVGAGAFGRVLRAMVAEVERGRR